MKYVYYLVIIGSIINILFLDYVVFFSRGYEVDSSLTALYGILGTFLSPIFFEYCKNRLGTLNIKVVDATYNPWRNRNFLFLNHSAPKFLINWLDLGSDFLKYDTDQYTIKRSDLYPTALDIVVNIDNGTYRNQCITFSGIDAVPLDENTKSNSRSESIPRGQIYYFDEGTDDYRRMGTVDIPGNSRLEKTMSVLFTKGERNYLGKYQCDFYLLYRIGAKKRKIYLTTIGGRSDDEKKKRKSCRQKFEWYIRVKRVELKYRLCP